MTTQPEIKLPPLPPGSVARADELNPAINAMPFNEAMKFARQCVLADRAGRAETWQPIATAPQNGRTLLLGYSNSLGNWRTVRGQWMSESYIADNWEDPDDAKPGWFETSVEADDAPSCWAIDPTHWMPLPVAPTQERGADDE